MVIQPTGQRKWDVSALGFIFILFISVCVILINVRSRLKRAMSTLSSRGLSRFYSCLQLCSIIHVPRYQYLFFIFPSVILPLVQLGCACPRSFVWDVGKVAWLSREPAADSKHIWLQCHRMCTYLTVELPTQRPVWAALSPDTMEHGKGGGERGRRGAG